YLSRKYGLTIDNLLEAEVVLADGRVVTASESEHPDLFWALRGGGGNFGVVTSFTFRLHPVHTVICGPTAWPVSATADILGWFRDFIPAQDEDLYGFFATNDGPTGGTLPRSVPPAKGVRCGLVLYGRSCSCRRGVRARPSDAAGVRGPRSGSVSGAAVHVRWPLPEGAAVVLARRLFPNGCRRRHRSPCPLRRGTADHALLDAPLPDRRCRPPGRANRHGVGVPRRQLLPSHR